jgi:serine/threonine protein kinase
MTNVIFNIDDFSQALKAFKQGDYDADMLIRKFDEFRSSMVDISEESLSELNRLVTEAKLPDELSKQIFTSVTAPKTRIFIPPAEAETPEDHSRSHLSSLLDELLKWDKGDENNEIQAGQTIRGTYRLVSRIGKGGMGEVWKAVDLIQDAGDSRDKHVAIKFINHQIRSHPYALKALVREFARYKKLIHPNIVKAYELNRDEREIFIVMEYLDGLSLKEFIKQHPGGISLNEAKPIIEGICKALKYAHKEGIIHLDLKPGNVFYDPKNKTSKVIDFGIARLSKQSDRDKTRFDPGSLGAVSTAYASVEMLLLEDKPDPRDDIYGLACVVYELISGKHPFHGVIATKAERDKMTPQPVKGLKKAEFQAILKALSFNKNDRTSSVEQFFQELYLPQITAKLKLHRWLIVLLILLLATLLIPLLINKGYDTWQKNQIIEGISQKQQNGYRKISGPVY